MKKTTFWLFATMCFVFSWQLQAQFTFPVIAGPTNVPGSEEITLNINDVTNTAGVNSGIYESFLITVDWVNINNAYSQDADVTVTTASGSVLIDPPTSGGASNGDSTTLTFQGDLAGLYMPDTDGTLDLMLDQSWSSSDCNWLNITITLFEAPSCVKPSALDATNILEASVDLNWNPGYTESLWNLEWGTAGFTQGSGFMVTDVNSTTYNLNTLDPITAYEFYVQSNCGAGDTSVWVGPFEFTTACPAVTAAPFSETFTDGTTPTCWEENGDTVWKYSLGASYAAQNAGDHTEGGGTNYAWMDGSFNSLSDVSSLTTPMIDVSTLTQPSFQFSLFSNNTNDDVASSIEVEIYDGAVWNSVVNITDLLGPLWETFIIDLSTYTITGPVQARFTVTGTPISNSSKYNDILLDDIIFDEMPSCPAPHLITFGQITDVSAEISWTAPDVTNLWNIEIVAAGGTPTGTPTHSGVSNLCTLNGLSPITSYDIYIQANCGSGDVSTWIGPYEFTTECAVTIAPWFDDVEVFTPTTDFETENCWDTTSVSAYDWNVDGSSSTPTFFTGPSAAFSGNNFFYVEASNGSQGDVAELLTPFIDLSGLTNPELTFYYHMYGSSMGDLYIDIYDGSNWIVGVDQLLGQQHTSTQEPWGKKYVDLSSYSGVIQIRFRAIRGSGVNGDISLDDISVAEPISCIEPSNLGTDNYTSTSVDLFWTEEGTATSWDVELLNVTAGETATGMPTDIDVSSPLTVSNLIVGNDYEFYVRSNCGVDDLSVWAGPFSFTWFPALANDDCVNAEVITITNSCANIVTYTATATEGSEELTSCDTSGNFGLWYQFIAPTSGALEFDSGIGSPGIVIYEGSCGALTEIAGNCFNNMDGSITGLTPGNTYYGMVWTDTQKDTVEFCLYEYQCVSATANFSVISNCDTNGDFFVDVDITDMGTATSLTISDDFFGFVETVASVGVVQFGPYTIGNEVSFTVNSDNEDNCVFTSDPIAFICPPSNDNCSGAIFVTHEMGVANVDSATAILGTIDGATDSGLAAESCNGTTGTANDDVWYTFEALTADVNITFDANFDSVVQLYSGTCTGGLTVVDCADDILAAGVEELQATGLTIGETYYVRIYQYASAVAADGTFNLKVWSPTTLGVGELEQLCQFSYYPNPVSSNLVLTAQKDIQNVTVYNMLGQQVVNATPNTMKVDLDMSNLQTGAYFVKVMINGTLQTIRVVKK
ncbi:fibronectin type III domain-containing protein [Mangrovimonas aestuarii]|uniref:fibronectin type III domain-containing protein n=1 Tax=Mangrovimonas aestuarii TaxID=3018443 RepID=UPI002378DB1D|nr:T9SS type A sorting domain-containing protein [Mangrovimonas aestuarii]